MNTLNTRIKSLPYSVDDLFFFFGASEKNSGALLKTYCHYYAHSKEVATELLDMNVLYNGGLFTDLMIPPVVAGEMMATIPPNPHELIAIARFAHREQQYEKTFGITLFPNIDALAGYITYLTTALKEQRMDYESLLKHREEQCKQIIVQYLTATSAEEN